MPRGMLLRSGLDWHLDVSEVHTLEAFLEERRTPRTAEPVRVETFRDYAEWFRQCKQIYPQRLHVNRVCRVDGQFEARCGSGETIWARRVLAAPGLAPFTNVPSELSAGVPPDRMAPFRPDRKRFGSAVFGLGALQGRILLSAPRIEECLHLAVDLLAKTGDLIFGLVTITITSE